MNNLNSIVDSDNVDKLSKLIDDRYLLDDYDVAVGAMCTFSKEVRCDTTFEISIILLRNSKHLVAEF